jgi:hypothetical protein
MIPLLLFTVISSPADAKRVVLVAPVLVAPVLEAPADGARTVIVPLFLASSHLTESSEQQGAFSRCVWWLMKDAMHLHCRLMPRASLIPHPCDASFFCVVCGKALGLLKIGVPISQIIYISNKVGRR